MVTKTCTVCKETKDIRKFWKNKKSPDGYDYKCTKCYKDYLKKYRSNNPPKEYRFNDGKPWKMSDIEYLMNSLDAPIMELAYALGRSYGAVAEKRSLMLRRKRIHEQINLQNGQ